MSSIMDLDTTRQHCNVKKVRGIPEVHVDKVNDDAFTHASDSRRFHRQQGIRMYDSIGSHSQRR
jgi:hypothetical protein